MQLARHAARKACSFNPTGSMEQEGSSWSKRVDARKDGVATNVVLCGSSNMQRHQIPHEITCPLLSEGGNVSRVKQPSEAGRWHGRGSSEAHV